MGKSKNLNRKPDEMLLGENRLLKKQIRSLQREVKEFQKQLSYNQNKDSSIKKTRKEKDVNECTTCGKGELITLDFGIRKITRCSLCDYQKVTK